MKPMTVAEVRMVEHAVMLAARAHKGQTDKAGAPYILHPLRVMASMPLVPRLLAAAVLHDVIEDTDLTLAALGDAGIPPDVLEALEHLIKRGGEEYMAFIERCSRNEIARMVKLADLEDNMDLTRIPEPTAKDMVRVEKYQQAKKYLLAVGRELD